MSFSPFDLGCLTPLPRLPSHPKVLPREIIHELPPEALTSPMDRTYLPVLLLVGFVVVNAVMILGLAHLITRFRPTPVKQQPYESGIPVLGDARERFSVKFYMVAMLFIVFDIETVFM